MLDPGSGLTDLLGDRPAGFVAREAWLREAAVLVARETSLDHGALAAFSMDDLGPEL